MNTLIFGRSSQGTATSGTQSYRHPEGQAMLVYCSKIVTVLSIGLPSPANLLGKPGSKLSGKHKVCRFRQHVCSYQDHDEGSEPPERSRARKSSPLMHIMLHYALACFLNHLCMPVWLQPGHEPARSPAHSHRGQYQVWTRQQSAYGKVGGIAQHVRQLWQKKRRGSFVYTLRQSSQPGTLKAFSTATLEIGHTSCGWWELNFKTPGKH